MFTDHFHMTDQPFTERLPAHRILEDERIRQGRMRLSYLIECGNIALLTGDTGVGKSTLIKLFIDSLAGNHYQPVYLHITHIRTTSLLKLIVSGLGEIPKNTKERLFSQILDKTRAMDATVLLIIDEAHLLSADALTDLRLLVSSALDDLPPLKIVLSGQENIRRQLRQACHSDLAQRISVKYHLPSLSQAQTHAYLDFHMQSVGSNDKVFEPEVKTLIHEYSSGIPRQINNIATACLVHAASLNTHKVNQSMLTQSLRECQI